MKEERAQKQENAQILIKGLDFAYGPGITALEDISLQIEEGERVALIGHNGSGKSTLARQLNGLLRPTRGAVWIKGINTAGQSVARLARKTALQFQHPDDQICKSRVWEEVAFGPENLGFSQEKTERLVTDSLCWFDLLSAKEKNPHDLRYSERKRLTLASVTAMDTPVIVLDEPGAGLDHGEIAMLAAAMDRLTGQGKTLILITHDMDFAAAHMPRFICLSQGKKVFDGKAQELFTNDTLLDSSHLLPPQMVRLSHHFHTKTPATTPDAFVRMLEKI